MGVSAKGSVEGDHVRGEGAGVIAAVSRHLGRRIPSHEGGHRPVASLGQFGQEVAVGPGGVRKAMQAQRQWPLAHLQVVKSQLVGLDNAGLEFWHGVFSCLVSQFMHA